MEIHWLNLASAAYAAYLETLKSFDVERRSVINWNSLTNEERLAWIAAVRECVDLYSRAVLA